MTNHTDTELDKMTENTTLYMSEGKYLCMNQSNNDSKSLEGKLNQMGWCSSINSKIILK